MTDRRRFLAGALAAGCFARPTWAEAGRPHFLSAGRRADGEYVLCGLDTGGEVVFERVLPARGHAAAAHPARAEAVLFARRPGLFALVIDCASGSEIARLEAPEGRHFYGHGTFSADGGLLFTTENDYEAARGVIGIWDVTRGYRRAGEIASGGVGPHDLRLLPDGTTLVVANGGIETHPTSGRSKLNIPEMRPNLGYLDQSGRLLERVELNIGLHRNSIRHLGVAGDGTVVFTMQWQGDAGQSPPLVGTHRRGSGPVLFDAPVTSGMAGYIGSVAISSDAQQVAVTSPRAGRLLILDRQTGAVVAEHRLADVCGVAPLARGFVCTNGQGGMFRGDGHQMSGAAVQWDNHLVALRR